ncbi:MAG: archease, partial [Elusimicrobia bacterium]|nr:archease [Elusimicrobiota bacterium]
MAYKIIDKSGDIGIRVSGKSLAGVLENAARAVYDLMADAGKVEQTREKRLRIRAENYDSLIINFLNAIIYGIDAGGFIGKKIKIRMDSSSGKLGLKAAIKGEKYSRLKHGSKFLLKAATYHNLKIENKKGKWIMEV